MFNDENSNATLTNATFFLNVASVLQDGGGAILISASSLTIKNSILYADIGIGGELRIINAGSAAIAYSIVQGGYAGTGNLNANPLLGSLGSYGGPTQTMLPGPGSPAIDSGTNTGCPGTDQRGMIRPQDGNGDEITICDMGATEVRVASASGTCYVSANAVSGFNDGTSWADAFISLQSALGTPACTQVWVAKGTYKPTANTDRTVSFALHSGMAVYGGFAGVETLLVQRNPAANPTILSGEIGAAGNTDNSYHVVVGSGTSTTARLDGFTITAGNAAGAAWPNTAGGGMYNASGSPSLANLTFSGNLAAESGGGMANQASSPTLTSVTFSANSAIAGGGGMYNYSASIPKLTNVTFSGNSTTGAGGAILNNGSSPKLTNVTISGNSAAAGGAIKNAASSSPVIKNSILHGDTGGEISNSSSTPSVTYSLIQGGYPGTGNLNANPLLKPLGNYGGPTKTMLLNYGSPAIDKGTNTGCPLKDQRGVTRPLDGDGNTIATCDMGATEAAAVVLLMKSFRSAGALDGWVLESAETSGLGGTLDAAADTLSVGDGTLDRQGRSILSFDTSSLPDSAVITSATLKIMKAGLVGVDPFTTLGNLLVDVRKGPFSNNLALQLTDFQAPASKNAALTILNNPINGWYAKAMPPVNLVYINKVGLTQFRLRFQLDDNDNGVADYLKFYSGNAAFASTRPVLILKYYLP
jgi:hypothetical protein